MGKFVKNKDDPPFEQKWVLVQFASRNMKAYKSGDTVGIKICGAFKTEEELKEKAEQLYVAGNIYFKLEAQKLGSWFGFPDYSQDKREDKEFINSKVSGGFEDVFDLNELYKTQKENDRQKRQLETEQKTTIKNSTYFYLPEKRKDLEYLLQLIFTSLDNFYNDVDFYKKVMNHVVEQIKKIQENPVSEKQEPELEIEDDVNYLELTRDPEQEQKYVLFSYVHEKTRQKSKTLGFKVRGVFPDMESFEERKSFIHKKDPVFDLCKIPVGVWIPINDSKSYLEAELELNEIVGLEIKKHIHKKKEFERRIENVKQKRKEGFNSDSEVLLTEEDLNKQLQETIKRVKETKEEIFSYFKMLKKNIDLHMKRYGKLNKELQEAYDIFSQKPEFKELEEKSELDISDKLLTNQPEDSQEQTSENKIVELEE